MHTENNAAPDLSQTSCMTADVPAAIHAANDRTIVPLDAALEYAARGWRVLPVHHVQADGTCSCPRPSGREDKETGKHPRILDWVNNATTDETTIRGWWTEWPEANVAIATGPGSNLLVIDVDTPEGHEGKDGMTAFYKLAEAHGLDAFSTFAVSTGSSPSGLHLYFQYPEGSGIGSGAGVVATGVDHRGAAGYVLAPPSNHRSGGRYAVSQDVPVAPCPAWLVQALKVSKAKPLPEPGPAPERAPSEREREKARVMLNRCCARLACAPEGKGRDALVKEAFTVGGLWPLPIEVRRHALLDVVFKRWERPFEPRSEAERQIDGQLEAGADRPFQFDEFALTETGNAERLASRHASEIRYVTSWGKWIAWDGKRWTKDGADQIVNHHAKETIRSLDDEIANMLDDDGPRGVLRKWATKSETRQAREAMIALAKSESGISIHHSALDQAKWLLNIANGTIDLKTGTLRPHAPGDFITKLAPRVSFDPAAKCPQWLKFLDEVMVGDLDMIRYLQRAAGYSLTSEVTGHCLFFLYGGGRNGKGVFTRTMLKVLGEYGAPAAPALLLAKGNDAHPTEQADLCGLRMALVSEIEEGKRWASGTVKRLTGGDEIKARRMHEDFWWFYPTHKLWISVNDRPTAADTSDGFWSRMKAIPFLASFRGREDEGLELRLESELAGIFNWALAGCLEWQRIGLAEPRKVTEATEEYRADQDLFGQFLEQKCELSPDAKVSKARLRTAYENWCREVGATALTAKRFKSAIEKRSITDTTMRDSASTHPCKGWKGIGLAGRR
jgi:putative DNA primase/helicase